MQLGLGLFERPDLAARLRAHGVPATVPITVHSNRRVMVSIGRSGALRVHQGYTTAPDDVVAALARWARPRITRDERRAAARVFLGFPVDVSVAPDRSHPRPPDRAQPGDPDRLDRLRTLHAELNVRYFGGSLRPIEIRLSGRMRRKLGHYEPAIAGTPAIVIGRRHLRRDGWKAAADTLVHEMVHQWQDESGLPIDHGREFRRKARSVGTAPRAAQVRSERFIS